MTEEASRVQDQLEPIIIEARDLRFGASLPPIEASMSAVHESLLDVRQRLDRVEELLFKATRIRYRVHRAHDMAKDLSDEAWDETLVQQRSTPVINRDERFVGAKERYADANLATFEQRRAAKDAAKVMSFVNEALDVVKIAHRGLADVRQDHMVILRSVQFESNLDR